MSRVTVFINSCMFWLKFNEIVIRNDQQLETGPYIVHSGCIDRVERPSLDRSQIVIRYTD